ncbi:PAS/PAC sensor signal transduction histidine kinase [Anaeromyxobacter dehalogenans 2CP-1]|uniref:histidine kinase n=1 Tax=Anaeromyxobacter dehalogenans (strain ATCC BAA-258 / DSM 21875 / 2CP-1) TaxID=455488 RepID=B8JCY8_ANAD2|nr:ATP-binding protein [Anaeromyxobacter dehalogenans]ACL64016.1 PAS/PAC sensor signal transduction histidine kinase [Anaeromyxobacter dehalogenans 2CP-1]
MSGSGAEPGLHRKLVWLTFFRLVTVTVLLGGTALVGWQVGGEAGSYLAPLYGVVAATYAGSLVFAVALRRNAGLVAVAYAQIALDVAIASAVGSLTGGVESVFVFMFSLAVVNGAILLYRRGAIAAAGMALLGYLVMLAATWRPGSAPVVTVFAHGGAFLVTAALASYLAELLRSTGERLAEREGDLEAITALHESIVQSLTSGLVTVDRAERVTFLNVAAEQVTGIPLARALGRPIREVLPLQAGTGRDEVEWVNARGERLTLGYTVFPLMGRAGAEIGSAAIFQDLTRLRAMEQAFQRSERLADLGRVAAGLAHELRNPLASMAGSVELLRAQAPLGGDERRLLDIVLREASRLDELVTEFLRFARPAPLRPGAVDLASLLEDALRVFTNDPAAAGLVLSREISPAPAACDPDQIRQVVWNLLRNAAQALGGRGGRIAVACGGEDGGAWFAVEDDGPGIPPAERERIFLPFHTTKERGTGLGLAVVQRIVDAHGGRVEVRSAPGQGARFTVHLPGPARAAETG